jgi:S1-C subfamily serine protease
MLNPRKPFLVGALVLGVMATPAIAQESKGAARHSGPPSLSPKEIASRAMGSVYFVRAEDSAGKPLSLGSGFAVESGGILTNYHVVKGGARVFVSPVERSAPQQSANKPMSADDFINSLGVERSAPHQNANEQLKSLEEYKKGSPALIVFVDESRDLALLDAGLSARPLEIAVKLPPVGSPIYALGNPEGLGGTFSVGNVSGFREAGNAGPYIQLTAPISHGSSGGPVLNDEGKVVGLAVASIEGGQNLNFAIPCTALREFLKQEGSTSRIRRIIESLYAKAGANGAVGGREEKQPDYSDLINILDRHWDTLRELMSDFRGLTNAYRFSDPEYSIADGLYNQASTATDCLWSTRALISVLWSISMHEDRARAWTIIKLSLSHYGTELDLAVELANGFLGVARRPGTATLANRLLLELRDCKALLESITIR